MAGEAVEFLDIFGGLIGSFDDASGIVGIMETVSKTILGFTFVLAALQVFFGYKLFKFWVAVCGFFGFGILGGVIGGAVTEKAGVAIFLAILCAIFGAVIAFKLYLVGVFIVCGFMGFLLGLLLTQMVELGLVLGIVLGVLGVWLAKPVIIISTSVGSGFVAGPALAGLLDMTSPAAGIILSIILVAAGIYVQFVTNRSRPHSSLPILSSNGSPISSSDGLSPIPGGPTPVISSSTVLSGSNPQGSSTQILGHEAAASVEPIVHSDHVNPVEREDIQQVKHQCLQCQQVNPEHAKFCGSCGMKLNA